MAYMSQERKKELSPKIKAVLKKYGVKGSISVSNHMTLVVTLKEGVIDFYQSLMDAHKHKPMAREYSKEDFYVGVNPYWFNDHYVGIAREFLNELINAMNDGNWNKSDIQSDYFNVGWYIDVNIGRWNRPYKNV